MKTICMSYEDGTLFDAYLVRYFRFKNNVYLIYTHQEKDDRDYMKLYVVKVMKELGVLVTQTVRRTDEWNLMKGIIKHILSEIKKGKINIIEDLNSSDIDKIVITEYKNFLLASDLVSLLSTTELDNKEQLISLDEEQIETLDLGDENFESEIIPEEIEILEL